MWAGLQNPLKVWTQTTQVAGYSGKTWTLESDRHVWVHIPLLRAIWLAQLVPIPVSESHVLFCTWTSSSMCPAPSLTHDRCPVMWSSYYCAEFGKGSFAPLFLTLLLPLAMAKVSSPFPQLHVNCAYHLRPDFSPTCPWKLPLRTLLQSLLSLFQIPRTQPRNK